mgnify:FL=1
MCIANALINSIGVDALCVCHIRTIPRAGKIRKDKPIATRASSCPGVSYCSCDVGAVYVALQSCAVPVKIRIAVANGAIKVGVVRVVHLSTVDWAVTSDANLPHFR